MINIKYFWFVKYCISRKHEIRFWIIFCTISMKENRFADQLTFEVYFFGKLDLTKIVLRDIISHLLYKELNYCLEKYFNPDFHAFFQNFVKKTRMILLN